MLSEANDYLFYVDYYYFDIKLMAHCVTFMKDIEVLLCCYYNQQIFEFCSIRDLIDWTVKVLFSQQIIINCLP